MKDYKLEQQFNEYFDGVEVPENLTADAKKYVETPKKRNALHRFVKIASVAASFIVCFTVLFFALWGNNFGGIKDEASNDSPSGGDSPDSYEPSDPSVPIEEVYYKTEDLTFTPANPYNISKDDRTLGFIEVLALADNASVTVQKANFKDGSAAFTYAEVTLIDGVRDEVKIYVEYTKDFYEELKDYSDGEIIKYQNLFYYLTQEFDESGEPVSKVHSTQNGVKYYLSVTSSDTQSYKKYVRLIFKYL